MTCRSERLTLAPSGRTYLLDGCRLPSVTQIMREMGVTDDLSHIPEHVLAKAAARGNAVHAATDLWPDVLPEFPEEYRPWLNAYGMFISDTGFRQTESEVPIASIVHGFAGRLDKLGWLYGLRTIVDVKVRVAMPADEVLYQTSGYALAYDEMNPDDPIQQIVGLQLKRNGMYGLVMANRVGSEHDLDIWLRRWVKLMRGYNGSEADAESGRV